jgi:uncharacterized membrane protein
MDIHLTLTVKGFEPGTYQVFYDRGNGFNDADSNVFHKPRAVLTTEITRNIVQKDYFKEYDFVDLYFKLPSAEQINRIKIGIAETNTTVIQKICVQNRYKSFCWAPEEIIEKFTLSENSNLISIQENLLNIQSSTTFLTYRANDFNELYIALNQEDRAKKIGSYFLILLFAIGFYWFLNRIKQIIALLKTDIKHLKPEFVFLIFGFIFGTLTLLINPPFQVPDEHGHFFRALQISQGELIADVQDNVAGGTIPKNAIISAVIPLVDLVLFPERVQSFEKLSYFLHLPPEAYDKQFVVNHSLYSPFPYLPQTVGISIGKVFHFSWLETMVMGRFFALITWLFCVYFAIKIIPISKWLLCLLALSPMALFQAASLSADSLTIGLSFLFIATILNFSFENQRDNFKFPLLILLLAILLSLCKQSYSFLILLFFIVPISRLGSLKKYLLFFTIILLSSIGFIALWFYFINEVRIAVESWRMTTLPPGQIVSASEQLNWILTHPLGYLNVLIKTTQVYGLELLKSFIIGKLGWADLPMPHWLFILHGFMLIFYAVTDSTKEISFAKKMVIFFVMLINVIVIYTSMYLTWYPVGIGIIDGLQGRFFVPIGILLFLMMSNNRLKISPKIHAMITITYVPFVLITMFFVLINRYYVAF